MRLLCIPQYRLPSTTIEYARVALAAAQRGRLDYVNQFNEVESDEQRIALGVEMLCEAVQHRQYDMVAKLLMTV